MAARWNSWTEAEHPFNLDYRNERWLHAASCHLKDKSLAIVHDAKQRAIVLVRRIVLHIGDPSTLQYTHIIIFCSFLQERHHAIEKQIETTEKYSISGEKAAFPSLLCPPNNVGFAWTKHGESLVE